MPSSKGVEVSGNLKLFPSNVIHGGGLNARGCAKHVLDLYTNILHTQPPIYVLACFSTSFRFNITPTEPSYLRSESCYYQNQPFH